MMPEDDRVLRAPDDVVNGVFDLLEEKGYLTNQSEVEKIVSFTAHWMERTIRGQEFMAHLLKLKSLRGKDDHHYVRNYPIGKRYDSIDPQKIFFLSGCIANGEIVPLHDIEAKPKMKISCSSCGAGTICTQELNGQALCSNCWDFDETASSKDKPDLKCDNCNFMECSWHPVNQDTPPLSEAYY